MLLDFLRPGVLSATNGDLDYLTVVELFGDTTDPYAHVEALGYFGIRCEFITTGDLNLVEQQIAKGIPVPVGWLHKGSLQLDGPNGDGHWSVITGFVGDNLMVSDPNGEANLLTGQYLDTSVEAGDQVLYDRDNFTARWEVEGAGTGWMILVTESVESTSTPDQGRPDRGEGRPGRGEGRSDRGEGRPGRGEGRSDRGEGKPDRGESRPGRGEGRPDRGEGRPDPGDGRPNRGKNLFRDAGEDVLTGESGNGQLYADATSDPLIRLTKVVPLSDQSERSAIGLQRASGYTITEDFTDGQDLIQLGVDTSGLQLNTPSDDTLLFQRSDLMTGLEDPSGIQRSGNLLV